MTDRPRIEIQRLGVREYSEVHALQQQLQRERQEGGSDRVLMLQHPPVLTLGRAHTEPKLRVAAPMLEHAGIPIVQTERGGDITYHGPGQLIAYPILHLPTLGLSATDLVYRLEESAIRLAARFGLEVTRDPRNRGAWAGGRKLASIGINVRKGVSMHGIAINIDPKMEHFELIEPCGLPGVEITSFRRELGSAPGMDEVEDAFLECFAEVFACDLEETAALSIGIPPLAASP